MHPTYENLTATQIGSAIQLPTEGPTMTTYYMIPTQNLPLLDPLRSIPVVGNPLADLFQPDLKVLVNLGYGDPDYGWSQGPANVPTEFGLFPPLNDVEKVPGLLVSGTQQGITDFMQDTSAELTSTGSLTPSLSSLAMPSSGPSAVMLPSPADLVSALSPVSVADGIYNAVNALSGAASMPIDSASHGRCRQWPRDQSARLRPDPVRRRAPVRQPPRGHRPTHRN